MAKYKALKEFEVGPEESHTVYEQGVVFEDTNVHLDIPTLLADGSIELVEEAPMPPMIDYVVVKGPLAIPEGEVFQTGNVVTLVEGDTFAQDAIKLGLIMAKADHDALPKEVVTGTFSPNAGAPTIPPVAGSVEPRKRYRGVALMSDTMRTVGAQTFHHIRTEDGHEYDLTDAEYVEVQMSYPPQK